MSHCRYRSYDRHALPTVDVLRSDCTYEGVQHNSVSVRLGEHMHADVHKKNMHAERTQVQIKVNKISEENPAA